LRQARKGVLAWTGAAAAVVLLALILFWGDLTGKADPTPTPTPSSAATSTASAQPTPTPTPDERSIAVAEAAARYRSAIAAIGVAHRDPRRINTQALVSAGVTDPFLANVISDLILDRDSGYYETGSLKILSIRETAVTLTGEQPQITLGVCADNSSIRSIERKTGKIAPRAPGNSTHPRFAVVMIKAAVSSVNGGKATWFAKDVKVVGHC